MQMPYIYMSFANKDLPEVQKLIEKLKAMGFRVMYDNGIQAGSEWAEQPEKIKDCSCFLAILSENSVASQAVRSEIGFALSQGKKIVTVCLDDITLSPSMSFKLSIPNMISGKGDTDRIVEEICKIDAVKACREEKKEDLFQTGKIPTVSKAPELPQEKAGVRCSVCGQLLAEDARFCFCCGNARGASAPTSSSASASATPPPVLGSCVAPPPSASYAASASPNMEKKMPSPE